MSAGQPITIVKLREDGSEATRYSGETLLNDERWVVARAPWGRPRIDLGYLVFEPDDVFIEYFARRELFNVIAVCTGSGELKGWYCNVAENWTEGDTLYWRDLYLDLIVYSDGRQLVLDEDELEQSGLAESDPALHRRVLQALVVLRRLAEDGRYPFSDIPVRAGGARDRA